MKLSVITDEIAPNLQQALEVVREFPIDQVELRTIDGVNISEADWGSLEHTRALLQENGLGVCSIASPVFKTDLFGTRQQGAMHSATERPPSAHLDILKHCIEVAHFFSAPLVRIFAFWRAGELTPERKAQILTWLESAVRIAEQEQVVLGLENEHACQVGTGKELAEVLSAFNSPYLRGVWDPGNAFQLGEPAQDGYSHCQPYVVHIHVKDCVRLSDGSYKAVIVGEGEIGYSRHFAQIAQSGYKGYLSLETHASKEGISQAEVSRLCLQVMKRMMDSLHIEVR